VENAEVAAVLDETADLMEILGIDSFKVRSYRRAAEVARGLGESLATVRERDGLESLPHIGKSLATKMAELLDTGRMGAHEELKAQVPGGLLEMLLIPGFGPKKAALVWRERGIGSVDQLEAAANAGELRELPGMGAKSEAKLLHAIAVYREGTSRRLLGEMLPVAERIVAELQGVPGVGEVQYAGSTRRMRETTGDLDILATTDEPEAIREAFQQLPDIAEIEQAGDTKISGRLRIGVQIDLRVLPPASYGAALVYFTGSKDHNIALRGRAQDMGLKISEWAIEPTAGGPPLPAATEEEVYAAVGLPWIAPELREDRGEIEAAENGTLPDLIELGDIRADLQMHSEWSDGTHSIAQMAERAQQLGYQYIAITDHSGSLYVAHGLDLARLAARRAEIEEVNETLAEAGSSFRVLAGTEVDILGDGSLDYPDDVLEDLDFVIGSLHQGFSDDRDRMTRRMLAAIESGLVDLIAHPTGRVLLGREGYPLDVEAVIEAAAEHRVALEINAFPQRLDLGDTQARLARERGVLLSINTDAHSPEHLAYMRYGVATARRAWASAEDVINCLTLEEFRAWRNGRRGKQ